MKQKKKTRKELSEFCISVVEYPILKCVSAYFKEFVSYVKKKMQKKEIFEFRISAVNYHISNGVSVYFAKFCSHLQIKKEKNAERISHTVKP